MYNISLQNVYCISWGIFKYSSARDQLNNERVGELHEMKRSRDKTKKCKEIT